MLSFLINYYRQSILLLFGGRLKLNKRLLVDIPSITKFIILWFWGLAEQNVLHLERFQSIDDGSSWLLSFSGCCYCCCCTLLDAIQSPDIADRVGLSTADKKNSANDEYKLRPACEQQRRCKETDSIRFESFSPPWYKKSSCRPSVRSWAAAKEWDNTGCIFAE